MIDENKTIIDNINVNECEYFSKYLWGDDNIYQNIVNKEKVTSEELVGTHLEGYPLEGVKKNICDASICCCSDKPNCIFKQYKRKEIECIEWKELNDETEDWLSDLSQIVKYDDRGCDSLDEVQECIEQLQKENLHLRQQLYALIEVSKQAICKGNECDLCREQDCKLRNMLDN